MPKIITLLLLIMVAQQTAPPRPTLIVTQPGSVSTPHNGMPTAAVY